MAMSFSQIPQGLLIPGSFVEIDPSGAVRGTPAMPHTMLLIGQKLSSGSAVAGQAYGVDASSASALFGYNSVLARAVRAAKRQNPITEMFAIGLADAGGGAKAEGDFTVTGTATEAGELAVYVGGRRVTVAVAVGDTHTGQVGPALLASLQAQVDTPADYAAGGGANIVEVAHKNAGTIGNDLKLGVAQLDGERVPAGLAVAVTQPTAGATDPDFGAAVTGMAGSQYHTVALCIASKTEIDKVLTELLAREDAMVQMEGLAFSAKPNTSGNLSTLGNSYNSQLHALVGYEISGLTPTVEEVAAQVAGEAAKQAQIDHSRPFTRLRLVGANGPHRAARFTWDQRNVVLSDGVSTLTAGADGGLTIDRLVTTYQTNGAGIVDPSYKDVTTMRNLFYLRFSINARFTTKYPRHKLAADGPVPAGVPMLTPRGARAEMIALHTEWVNAGHVQGAGEDYFAETLLVEIDPSDPNRLNIQCSPTLVSGLIVIASKLLFIRG